MISELSVAIPLAAISVLGSGFCSGSEVAMFSLRRVEREQLAKSDRFADRRIVKLLERPRRLIATVLIGNEAFNSILAVLALGVVMQTCVGWSLWAIGATLIGYWFGPGIARWAVHWLTPEHFVLATLTASAALLAWVSWRARD